MPRSSARRGTEEPIVLLIPEAAEMLRVSTDTIRRMIRAGELEAHKLRAQWRIPRAAVDALLVDGRATKATAATKRAAARRASTKRSAKTTTKRKG